MRILYVWDAEYPWDVRTEKICRTLFSHGHEVVITARNRRGERRREDLPEGRVERLPAFPSVLASTLSFPAFFNPFWLHHLDSVARRHRSELVIVRDLPLAPAALFAIPKLPVILDMAENYPAMIADVWTDRRTRPWDFLVRNPRIVSAVERYTLHRVHHVWTVVEESRERLLGLGISPAKVSVVSNTPPKANISEARPRANGSPLRVVYLGLMERHRGVGDLLEAVSLLARSGVPFQLDLVGDGRDFSQFRSLAHALGLDPPRVVFHGRLPHREALGVVRKAHVGVIPHHARESWNTTVPNKLFDYMAAGLAVLGSDAAPVARILHETGAGLLFRSGDAVDCARQLREMNNLAAWENQRRKGLAAIGERYNWEVDSEVLLHTVRTLNDGVLATKN